MTELETGTERTPEEAAAILRETADELESGEEITVPGTEEKLGTCLEVEHEIRGEYDQVEIEIEFDWTIIPAGEE